MGLKIFLHYYDGEYRFNEFGKIEMIDGKPYYEGEECKIGDKFDVPTKNPYTNSGKYIAMQTCLGYCRETDTWHFKGFENFKADEIYSRKV